MKIKELLMADTSYYQVYKFLPWTTAKELSKMTLMSMLIDADSFASERLNDDYNYFMCTNEYIKSVYRTGWSDNTVNTYFKELEEEGYIKTKRVAKPKYNYPPRYVKINNQILMDMYQNLNDVPQNLKDVPQNLLLNKNNNKNKKKEQKQDIVDVKATSGVLIKKRNNYYYEPQSEEPLEERSDLVF